MSRRQILDSIRAGLSAAPREDPPQLPPPRLVVPDVPLEGRISSFELRLETLAGRVLRAATPQAASELVRTTLAGRRAIASNAPYLQSCGISRLPGVLTGLTAYGELREACATRDVGITSADYALADTGTLVLLSSPAEARLISLLPPAHIAVVPCDRLLTGLDELFSVLPDPAAASSSMVLITGPSRTADIEQILVRGVHGPGEITVVLVE